MADRRAHSSTSAERAALVGLVTGAVRRIDAEQSLEELSGLADAAGAAVVLRMLQERAKPDAATFIGSGKVTSLAAACAEADVDVVIFDNELTPAQLRLLEERLERKVIDRTQLILDIFARRARTREGKWQVELAQLKYLLPRLVGSGTALSRLGGGIGTRGPGETKLEMDRRRIRARIAQLRREIDEIRRAREGHRQLRRRRALPLVALVGYTNVGKSTLLNALTRSDAYAANVLFATLDPLTRRVRLPRGQEVLLSDTVGFIAKLPTTVVAAFCATLEELDEADLLLHVVDLTNPHAAEQNAIVHEVLDDLELGEKRVLTVINKVDALVPADTAEAPGPEDVGLPPSPDVILTSALRGWGLDELLERIETVLAAEQPIVEVAIPYSESRLVNLFRRRGRVISERYTEDGTVLRGQMPRTIERAFAPYLRRRRRPSAPADGAPRDGAAP